MGVREIQVIEIIRYFTRHFAVMHKRNFLVVDDDADDLELFSEAVGELDESVICEQASDGYEALEKLGGDPPCTPDLIFLDLNMPAMDGWQFLERVKQNETLKDIPVIIYSTSSLRKDMLQAKQSGALCFVTKPEDYGQLKKILQIVISYLKQGELGGVCDAVHTYLTRNN
jgi:CheY-like chemotaxis protein